MSDLTTDVCAPLKKRIGDAEYEFRPLSIYDKADFLRDRKEARKRRKVDNLKLAGIASDQAYLELEAIDDETWGEEKWIAIANDKEGGQAAILEKSLSLTYPDQARDLSRRITWPSAEVTRLVAFVAGLSLVNRRPDEPEGPDVPPSDRYANPTA